MSKFVFGIDVGGTTVKMGLFDVDGQVLDKWEIPTRIQNNGENILPDIAKAVNAKMQEKEISKEDVVGVGIGVPGPVNDEGIVQGCANLGWGKVNINKDLSERIGMPVKGGNDANVAALGEMWKGGGENYKHLAVVTLGTGVGGGIIIDGNIVNGFGGSGGEIGHMHVQDGETDVCGCGNQGCLEQYASATGIVRLA
ncbi:MAG: ROK family protein, partial [Lachnospiraceae bacterium]|nr:ROK family protein [Lachnospiraceae bacterium]